MKKKIEGKTYDTETAKQIDVKYVGGYGEAHGYEERLYITIRNLYFIYGIGGPDSPYPAETIKPLTKEQADAWKAEISANKTVIEEKSGKPKKSVKTKKPVKTAAKKPVEEPKPEKESETKKEAEITEDKTT